MNIGEAASRSGLPTKTIRYYESIGLVASTRLANGFRQYGEQDVRKLRFIGGARSLGFTIDECRELIELFEAGDRPAAETAALGRRHIQTIHGKIALLRALAAALAVRSAGEGSHRDGNFPSLDADRADERAQPPDGA